MDEKIYDELKDMEIRLLQIVCGLFGDPINGGNLGKAWFLLLSGIDEAKERLEKEKENEKS